MCKQIRTVAKVSPTLAAELGVNFKDSNGDYVVGLQLAEELDASEFDLVPANYVEDDVKGILPLNPKKPIVRPKP